MSQSPPIACPRCGAPACFGATICAGCRQPLNVGADGLTPKQRSNATLCSVAGGVLSFLGAIGTLLTIAIAISGPSPAQKAEYANGGWGSVVLVCFALFALPPLGSGIALLWSGRNIRRKGKAVAPPVVAPPQYVDPVTRVEQEIRQLLRLLTGPYRESAIKLAKELEELLRRHRELEGRLSTLSRMTESLPGAELDGQRATLQLRLETERDAMIVEALQKQLRGIESQIESRESAEASCARLKAARDASFNTLQCLKAELLALSANASDRGREALEAETGDLRELHAELHSTRLAAEEVLRISQSG